MALTVVVGIASAAVVSGVSSGGTELRPATPIPPPEDPSLVHIHGLGGNQHCGDRRRRLSAFGSSGQPSHWRAVANRSACSRNSAG